MHNQPGRPQEKISQTTDSQAISSTENTDLTQSTIEEKSVEYLQELLNKKSEMQAKVDECRKELKDNASKLFSSLFAPVFEKFPRLETIRWTQYIPGFNDGDPCVFTASLDFPTVILNNPTDKEKEELDEYGYVELSYLGSEEGPGTVRWQRYLEYGDTVENLEMSWEIGKIAKLLSDDDLEAFFGCDVEIRIHRDGTVNIESYDCGY